MVQKSLLKHNQITGISQNPYKRKQMSTELSVNGITVREQSTVVFSNPDPSNLNPWVIQTILG